MSAVLDVCSFSRQPAVLATVAEQADGPPGPGVLGDHEPRSSQLPCGSEAPEAREAPGGAAALLVPLQGAPSQLQGWDQHFASGALGQPQGHDPHPPSPSWPRETEAP